MRKVLLWTETFKVKYTNGSHQNENNKYLLRFQKLREVGDNECLARMNDQIRPLLAFYCSVRIRRLEADVRVVPKIMGRGHLALYLRASTGAEVSSIKAVEEEAGAY